MSPTFTFEALRIERRQPEITRNRRRVQPADTV
jgi:hypothetical protein